MTRLHRSVTRFYHRGFHRPSPILVTMVANRGEFLPSSPGRDVVGLRRGVSRGRDRVA